MKLEDAEELAGEIVEHIHPFCEHVEVAGSIRRKKSEVRDIDLVLIPKPLLWHRIISTLQRTMDAEVLKRGDSIAQLTIKGVNVDLYSATPETWGTVLLIRTGSMAHNIKLSQIALRKGMRLTHKRREGYCFNRGRNFPSFRPTLQKTTGARISDEHFTLWRYCRTK